MTDADGSTGLFRTRAGRQLHARRLLLEHFAGYAPLLRLRTEWHECGEIQKESWFRLLLRAHTAPANTRVGQFVNAVRAFCDDVRAPSDVHDTWFGEAIRWMIMCELSAGQERPTPSVTGSFYGPPDPVFVLRYRGQSKTEARREATEWVEATWNERGWPQRSARPSELTRDVGWLFMRMTGKPPSAIARELQLRDEQVSEEVVRRAISVTAALVGIRLRDS